MTPVFSHITNGVKLQVVKEIQISHHMTIYGPNSGVFKPENNECFRNGEKIKIVAFLIDRYSVYFSHLQQ